MNAPATFERDLRAEFPGMVTADGKKVALKEELSSTGIPMGRFYLA